MTDVILSGSGNWAVPSNVVSPISVTCFGPGGNGANGVPATGKGGGGAGSGARSVNPAYAVTPGASIPYAASSGGSNSPTTFDTAGVVADYGRNAIGSGAGAAGTAAASTGTTKTSGSAGTAGTNAAGGNGANAPGGALGGSGGGIDNDGNPGGGIGAGAGGGGPPTDNSTFGAPGGDGSITLTFSTTAAAAPVKIRLSRRHRGIKQE